MPIPYPTFYQKKDLFLRNSGYKLLTPWETFIYHSNKSKQKDVRNMTKLSEQELKLLVSQFLETNPTDAEIEAFYINTILSHTKLSIKEITAIN